ncbi:MAG: universal stress protein [Firmicutes bacterium]|nr:universal stress protein [Bacillota bacterium]
MYRKILACVDGSPPSLRAARQAVGLARLSGAVLVLFYAVPPLAPYAAATGEEVALAQSLLTREMVSWGEEILQRVRAELGEYAEGLDIRQSVAVGPPGRAILKELAEGGYDLVVVGSRGLGEWEGLLLGSVSNKVAHQAPCPVLIVR